MRRQEGWMAGTWEDWDVDGGLLFSIRFRYFISRSPEGWPPTDLRLGGGGHESDRERVEVGWCPVC